MNSVASANGSQPRWGMGAARGSQRQRGAVETPEEALVTAYQEAQATLAKEMLTRLTQQDPAILRTGGA
jgi:restriction endonuclease Mrr